MVAKENIRPNIVAKAIFLTWSKRIDVSSKIRLRKRKGKVVPLTVMPILSKDKIKKN